MSFDSPFDSSNICSYISTNDFNSRSNNNEFQVFHQNIRSFNKNYDEFSVFLKGLSSDIDILVFTETWFTVSYNCEIDGYTSYHVARSNIRGGGVSVFVRNTKTSSMLIDRSFVAEFMCCSINVKCNKNSSSSKKNVL